jgi:hypothetical protein
VLPDALPGLCITRFKRALQFSGLLLQLLQIGRGRAVVWQWGVARLVMRHRKWVPE